MQLTKDAGFGECFDIGGRDKFEFLGQFAWFWLYLTVFQTRQRDWLVLNC